MILVSDVDISPSTYRKEYTACAFKLQLPAEYSVFCSVKEKGWKCTIACFSSRETQANAKIQGFQTASGYNSKFVIYGCPRPFSLDVLVIGFWSIYISEVQI